jgi:hypothetical protein
MSANNYMSIWLVAMPVSNEAGSQAYRYLWVQGQSQGSLSSQQALVPGTLNLGQLASISPEFCFVAKVIIRYFAGNWSVTEVSYLTTTRTTSITASGSFLSVVTTDATLTGDGTVGNPLSVAVTGSSVFGQYQANFASPMSDKEFTVSDANVTATSKIVVVPAYEDTTENTADEVAASGLVCTAGKPGVGSFTLHVASHSELLYGNYKFNYSVG